MKSGLHLRIHLTFDPTSLTGSTTRITHYLGVNARKEYGPNHPVGVPEHGATKKNHLEVNGVFPSISSYSGVKPIHVSIWVIALDMESIVLSNAVHGRAQICEYRRSISRFKIAFPVKVLRLNICNIVLLGCGAYQDVCRDGFVVYDLHEIAHTNVFPQGLPPVCTRRLVILSDRITLPIQRRVRFVKFDIGVVIGMNGRASFDVFLVMSVDALAPRPHFRSYAPDERPSLSPRDVRVKPFTSVQDSDSRMVDLTVGLVAFYVLIGILNGCDTKDDEEGKDD